jgi:hypothetical protein
LQKSNKEETESLKIEYGEIWWVLKMKLIKMFC